MGQVSIQLKRSDAHHQELLNPASRFLLPLHLHFTHFTHSTPLHSTLTTPTTSTTSPHHEVLPLSLMLASHCSPDFSAIPLIIDHPCTNPILFSRSHRPLVKPIASGFSIALHCPFPHTPGPPILTRSSHFYLSAWVFLLVFFLLTRNACVYRHRPCHSCRSSRPPCQSGRFCPFHPYRPPTLPNPLSHFALLSTHAQSYPVVVITGFCLSFLPFSILSLFLPFSLHPYPTRPYPSSRSMIID